MEEDQDDHLPGMNTFGAWAKITGIMGLLLLINIIVFFASFGWGVMVTIPFTVFMAFLLMRDMLPRHRLPRGRAPRGLA